MLLKNVQYENEADFDAARFEQVQSQRKWEM